MILAGPKGQSEIGWQKQGKKMALVYPRFTTLAIKVNAAAPSASGTAWQRQVARPLPLIG